MFTILADLECVIATLETETPLIVTQFDSAERFRVVRVVTSTPLRFGEKAVFHGNNRFTHKSLRARNRFGTDFPNVDTLRRDPSDLEQIVVSLVVTPAHGEEIADFDRSNVLVHCGDSLVDTLKKVKLSIVVKVDLVATKPIFVFIPSQFTIVIFLFL